MALRTGVSFPRPGVALRTKLRVEHDSLYWHRGQLLDHRFDMIDELGVVPRRYVTAAPCAAEALPFPLAPKRIIGSASGPIGGAANRAHNSGW